MTLIGFLLFIVITGVVLWLIKRYVPMDEAIKTILTVIVIILILLVALEFFGIYDTGLNFRFNNKLI